MTSRSDLPPALDLTSTPGNRVSITRVAWHGWQDCFQIQNGVVEAIVVPAIGRVMQFRLLGDPVGSLWGNPALDGQANSSTAHHAQPNAWLNFGGDKCWPAPQSSWPQRQGRDWPPPLAFDGLPMEAVATERSVVLTSTIDQAFGIQLLRTIELDCRWPVMRIRSEFHKLTGSRVKAAIWTITQLRSPERVSILLSPQSRFPDGYVRLMGTRPEDLQIGGGVLSLVRHRCELAKIGTDGASLVWVGQSCVVRIDAEQGPGEYPDGGCVTQVYTNPDPLPYVELETMGPLTMLDIGDCIERTAVYTVSPRSSADPQAEVLRAF